MATNNVDQPQVPKSASNKLKILSRNALYTPIATYTSSSSSGNGEKGSSISSQVLSRNLEKKLREKNLFSFLEEVSVKYHNPTTSADVGIHSKGGNHGGRMKSIIYFQRNLAQRALTLLGGGVGNSCIAQATTDTCLLDNNSNAPSSSRRSSKRKNRKLCSNLVHGAVSNRKRKKRCLSAASTDHRKESVASSMKSNTQSDDAKDQPVPPILPTRVSRSKGGSSITSNQNHTATTNTLIGLNELWTSYIKLLLRDHMPSFEQTNKNKNIQPNEIASLLSSAELVGAFVTITQCGSHISHCGKSGFIVDVTANTWRVAVVPNGVAWEFGKDCMADLASRVGGTNCWKVVTVPKRGSTLVLSLPVCCSSTTSEKIPSTTTVAEYCCVTISGDV